MTNRLPLLIALALLLSPPAVGAQVVPAAQPAVLVGAGDIASCDEDGDEATARLLDRIPGTVFTLGDNVYAMGTAEAFARCYHPTWGRHKARTRPTLGDHDYTREAAAYFAYFGAAAGEPGKGYYSYDLGAWHIVALNSNCGKVLGGCAAGSPQERWLRADLAANAGKHVLAYWHHPRFSSGEHGGERDVQAFWQALYEHGAEVVLGGNDHTYERFVPQDPAGRADPAYGIRQFVVGTGGRSHDPIDRPRATSAAHSDRTFGVLKLTLHPDHYEWEFIPVAGQRFTDSGRGVVHGPPPRGAGARPAPSTPAERASTPAATGSRPPTPSPSRQPPVLVTSWLFSGSAPHPGSERYLYLMPGWEHYLLPRG